MAQRVSYLEDEVTFTEGPFVMVTTFGRSGVTPHPPEWRLEVELKKYRCSVLPDISVIRLLREEKGWTTLRGPEKLVEAMVNWANLQVERGVIALSDKGVWVAPKTLTEWER
jgi:hypothetical protein